MLINNLKKYLLIAAGILCVALGVAGIFLPLLPTTPFFLLAAACFFRSSERLYAWLLNHKFLGKRIKYYRVYKAISLRSKWMSLVLLWLTIGYSAFFVVNATWLTRISHKCDFNFWRWASRISDKPRSPLPHEKKNGSGKLPGDLVSHSHMIV